MRLRNLNALRHLQRIFKIQPTHPYNSAAAAIATAYREAGYEVCGTALAGKAAENLQQEAGIRSRTLHSWEDAWVRRGVEKLHAGNVLVVGRHGRRPPTRPCPRPRAARQRQGDPPRGSRPVEADRPGRRLPRPDRAAPRAPASRPSAARPSRGSARPPCTSPAAGSPTALDAYEKAGCLHLAGTRAVARAELPPSTVPTAAPRRALARRSQPERPKLAARLGKTFREHREKHPEPPQV